jgi:tetratricopeptide (TPR) repeat protein
MDLQTRYKELRALVRKAQYDDALASGGRTILVVVGDLQQQLPPLTKINFRDEEQIKTLVLLSECFDYYGRFKDAYRYSQLGREILSSLPKRKTVRDELSQAKVRLAVSYARSMYRRAALVAAEKFLIECRDYVVEYIANPMFPNHGTLGEIAYTLGRVYRQQERFSSALREFNVAIKEYDDRIAFIAKHRVGQKNVQEEEVFSAHKIATIVALGVAWCNYTRGALSAAIQGNLIPARMLLRKSGDVLNRAYADVVYASASRALTRKDEIENLKDVRELVRNAQQAFAHYHHRHYLAGATLELALIESLLGNVKNGRTHLHECETSHAEGNYRWLCSAKVARSRLLRHQGKFSVALKVANEALELARKQKNQLAQIDALIARSEVFRLQGRDKQSMAIEDLHRALDLNQRTDGTFSNPKVHAVCHLHLAQVFLSQDRKDNALASFAEWEKVSAIVEHVWVIDMANGISKKIDRMQKLTVDVAQDGLKYRVHDDRLRRFLIAQAKLRYGKKQEIASSLGITRPRLNRWLRRFGRLSPR